MYLPSIAFTNFCNKDILDHRASKLLNDFDVLVWGTLCLYSDSQIIVLQEIANRYGAHLNKVQKSIRKLIELDFITKNKKTGQNWSYRLGIRFQKFHANFKIHQHSEIDQ